MVSPFYALELWRRALVSSVRGDSPDLSARQMALLLSVYMTEGPHTVRGLAQSLNISKPSISRALDRLGELGFVLRERDELDRRSVLVRRTLVGGAFLQAFSDLIVEAGRHVDGMADKDLDFGLAAMMPPLSATDEPVSKDSWIDVAA